MTSNTRSRTRPIAPRTIDFSNLPANNEGSSYEDDTDEDMHVEINAPEIDDTLVIPYKGSSADALEEDLARSGLIAKDIRAALVGLPEIQACKIRSFKGGPVGAPAYVIPYFGFDGKRVPFYRVRTFNPNRKASKYLQPAGTSSFIYFPPAFNEAVKLLEKGQLPRSHINGFKPSIIIVEGEKKAAKAVQEGFLCIGLGGIYNWKSRTIILPEAAEVTILKERGQVKVKMPSGLDSYDLAGNTQTRWAEGMDAVIAMAIQNDMNIIIAHDADSPPNPKVQVAAAQLAFELRAAGIPISRIRQLHFPNPTKEKVSLDDFLMKNGADGLEELIHATLAKRTAFPSHPMMREYVNATMAHLKTRPQAKDLAVAVIADMDAHGARMRDDNSGDPYFFDQRDKNLMKVSLMRYATEPLHENEFGQFLFKQYDISQADTRLLPWLAAYFTGEAPVYKVQPRSIITPLPNGDIAYQINDGSFALITSSPNRPVRIMDNGSGGLLFKSSQVEPPDIEKLKREIARQLKAPLEPWWYDVLKEFKFSTDEDRKLAAILFYISPWFLRWQGTQLPVELMIGEPGSGKSSMYMLRAAIITGRPTLRNQPNDTRDWYSSITATDGLHITDNVHFGNKETKQRISDEICRIITEPDPYVEMRKLYTTSDNFRIPVRSVFAFTAIAQPFSNADILQRAAIFELNAVGGNHDSNWVRNHLAKRGGREAWIAHHLVATHKFLHLAKELKGWDNSYMSKHRLVNYEQLLCRFGEMMGIASATEIRDDCMRSAEEQVADNDWTMEALREYCTLIEAHHKDPKWSFSLSDIAEWATYMESYKDNTTVTNARKLSRYVKSHITMVSKITGLYEVGKQSNVMRYRCKKTN
jgi:hypothetical protein